MAGIKFDVSAETKELHALIKSFPTLQARIFAYIGKRGRLTLKGQLLSGQEIMLRKDTDIKGRHTITHSVMKKAQGVRFSSYPVNLFERGRTLRSGKREPGKRIITRKFKALVDQNLQKWSNDAMKKIMDPEIKKA